VTTEAFADLLQAQRTSAGRWKARCPAHADRSPSLSIRQGDDGRVLLHCFAGCALDSILAALKLSSHDLFPGARLVPSEARRIAQERERCDAEARNRRAVHGAACDRVRRWEAIVSALGAKLARSPEADGAELTRLFHQACERQREAEAEADKWLRQICPKLTTGE
jgi:hypothetical protein